MDLNCGGRITLLLAAHLPYTPIVVRFGRPLSHWAIGIIQIQGLKDLEVARQMCVLRCCPANLQGYFISKLIVLRQMFIQAHKQYRKIP
jgi:hypothetical protein